MTDSSLPSGLLIILDDRFVQTLITHEEDVLGWCQPVISDVVRQYYASIRSLQAGSVDELVQIHVQSWMALVAGDNAKADALQEQVFRLAAQSNVAERIVDAANAAVLSEITDIIVTRFRRGTYSKAACAQTLLDMGDHLLQRRRRPV